MDLREAAGESFVLMDQRSTMSTLLSHIFAEEGFTPRVLFETGNNHTILSMIRAKPCCALPSLLLCKGSGSGFLRLRPPLPPYLAVCRQLQKRPAISAALPVPSYTLMKEQWGDETAAEETASTPNP